MTDKRVTTSGRPPEREDGPTPTARKKVDGQYEDYWVLPEEERAKGFIRPYRDSYVHNACGALTTMGRSLSETYARDPYYYGSTFCTGCHGHFTVDQFVWDVDGKTVGS